MMSPDEVRACYRLYAAYRTSCVGPFRRVLASLMAQLAQIAWTEPKTQKQY